MISLSQSFPLLVGDLVPFDNEHWESFLLLLKICKIALSPFCSHDTVIYLQQLIEEKLEFFQRLYPQHNLIPKFHYMIHYPQQILKFGPLVHSWTMRQEAKLSFFKRISRKSNYKNICKTVAKKHQLWQCYTLLRKSHFLHPSPEFSPKSINLQFSAESDSVKAELLRHFPSISSTESTIHPNWVRQHVIYSRKVCT